MFSKIIHVLLLVSLCHTSYSADDMVGIPVEQIGKNVVREENHHDDLSDIHRIEERISAKTAMCCRMSGTVVDVVGSITGYLTAAFATASAIPGMTDEEKRALAICAGVGGIVTGILHNVKPMVERISKEKEDRAVELHAKHAI